MRLTRSKRMRGDEGFQWQSEVVSLLHIRPATILGEQQKDGGRGAAVGKFACGEEQSDQVC